MILRAALAATCALLACAHASERGRPLASPTPDDGALRAEPAPLAPRAEPGGASLVSVGCDATAEAVWADAGDSKRWRDSSDRADAPAPIGVQCPMDCTTDESGLWGTDVYSADSSVCRAAVHAGLGSAVVVEWAPGQPSYEGSDRHGVTSSSWDTYEGSFTLRAPRATDAFVGRAPDPPPGAARVDCSTTAAAIVRRSTPARVVCPHGCGGAIAWGTDLYTDDSSICSAAIHAGAVGSSGGSVLVVPDPPAGSYPGTARGGVTTHTWAQPWPRAFRVTP